MVIRKPTLPYPTSPPPPPPDVGPTQSNHSLDSTELPPIPQVKKRITNDSPYHDMGNPWQDDTDLPRLAQEGRINHADVRPGPAINPIPVQTDAEHVPDILKPGWSGENTPRSSLDSDRSRDFWESSDDEKKPDKKGSSGAKKIESEKNTSKQRIPSILQIKRKPVSPKVQKSQDSTEHEFGSNNPFRTTKQQSSGDALDSWTYVPEPNVKGKEIEETSKSKQAETNHDALPNFAFDPLFQTQPLVESSFDTSPWESVSKPLPPVPSSNPPPVPVQQSASPHVSALPPSPFSEQPPLIAVDPISKVEIDPWKASPQPLSGPQSPLPEQKAVYSNDLLDRGAKSGEDGGLISLGDELKALPNHGPASTSQTSFSLLDDPPAASASRTDAKTATADTFQAPPGPPPSHSKVTTLRQELPRINPLSEAEISEMTTQRNETYQVKHFRWFDHKTNKLRSSSMLTQNKNGPCPLLALVNALILGAHDRDQAALDDFLRIREQVTLGTIIENLMMELLAAAEDGDLPDVDELNRFLLKLRTGMNMNPRFVPPTAPAPNLMDARNSMLHIPETFQSQEKPGTFEPSSDLQMYSAFGIQTVHGWLPEPVSDAAAAFKRTAQNYEDAQAKLFGEDELEYKLTRNGLSPEEQVIWEDIVSMKHFLQSSPTQLTHYGLQCIKSSMSPGSFSVLFRNDHFSTIYRHPKDGQIYSLITDSGYADRDEIIWESLVDTSGHDTEFFSGDFKSVSHSDGVPQGTGSRRQSTRRESRDLNEGSEAPLSPSQRQEQEDADLAMAMQLQEEEEQNDRQRRSQNSSGNPPQPPRPAGRRSTGNIPIPIRSNTGNANTPGPEVRSLVPPRGSRPTVQGVNRPSNATDPDAPPAYEEAARGKAYHPPLGSPLHPSSSADGSNGFGSTSSVNVNQVSGSNQRPTSTLHNRRSSAYGENSARYSRPGGDTTNDGPSPAYDLTDGRMPGSYIHTGRGGHGHSVGHGSGGPYGGPYIGGGSRQRGDRDRDCIVM